MLSADSGCNELVLKVTYYKGLNRELLAELVCHDDQVSLYALYQYVHLPHCPIQE